MERLDLSLLPAVHDVLSRLEIALARFPRTVVVAEIRRVLEDRRDAMRGGASEFPPIEQQVTSRLEALDLPSLRPVINATGVVLHTNLGRAPVPAFDPHRGYTNLEY